ncbi:MAG: Ig-like domain-containing protein [Prevotella sp.]|nr:Ig-like domain-containing protein [Prevotella sp.]
MKRLLFCLWGIIVPVFVFSLDYSYFKNNYSKILTAPQGVKILFWSRDYTYIDHLSITSCGGYWVDNQEPIITISDTSIVDVFYVKNEISNNFLKQYFFVKGKKAGKSKVVVKWENHTSGTLINRHEDTYEFTVVEVTSITIPSNLTLKSGAGYTISPTYTDSRADPKFSWSSSDTSVATVSSSGYIKAGNLGGYTTIICEASGVTSNKCEVYVYPVKARSISLDPIYEIGLWETKTLTPVITPSDTEDKRVTWRTSDKEIAIVDDDGVVTPVKVGKCKVIVTTADGTNINDTCQIKVIDDYLSIENTAGVPSGSLVHPILLNNVSDITGMQFEIQLPDGVSVAQDKSGNLLASLSDRANDQMITGSRLSNGNYQFVVFSKNSKPLLGNEGAIAYVTLKISPDMAIGDYTIGMKNIELTTPTGKAIYNMDKSAKLTIDDVKMGDVNGDGRVTVTDAVCIVNYIHERYPSVFIDKAADVNGDGTITITDAVGIINMIQNQ